jgi:hypothetical protein
MHLGNFAQMHAINPCEKKAQGRPKHSFLFVKPE